MSILPFSREQPGKSPARDLIHRFSIEVIPRTAAKIPDFRTLLPAGTRVYVAHIEGTSINDMVTTAGRLRSEGFCVMPHIPARIIADRNTFDTWLNRYRSEADVTEALVLAGNPAKPCGAFHSSMQLLETGLFDHYGFKRLHVAGHPEGNRDIDGDRSTRRIDEAALWKSRFAERTDADMALVTQFAFQAEPVMAWARAMQTAGVDLPIHVGVAGPTKLNTLLKYAIACGVGPSISVLRKRALDLRKLAAPFEPTDVLRDLERGWSAGKAGKIEAIHLFPLGGIKAAADYMNTMVENGRAQAEG